VSARAHDAARLSRRALLVGGTVLAGLCAWPRLSLAEEAPVPISLQVELLLKVAAYDKNLPQRAAGRLRLTILVKKDDPDSARSAAQARSSLSKTSDVLGLPLESNSVSHSDAPALAQLVRSTNVGVLYLMPGFVESELVAIAQACAGLSVLSVGALARYAEQGTVLALDLVGGKPKLIVHLARAKRQHVDLSSNVLKLMRVIE
jgi:YfiR/HmsC-like